MRGLAAEGDLVPLDAERAEHDAQRQIHRLQHRPLLDVQLEVSGRVLELLAAPRARGRARRRALAARRAARRRRRRAADAARPGRPSSRRPPTSRTGAPEARALLVGPVHQPHGHRRLARPRPAAAAPRPRPARSGSRRASRRSEPSRCARRSAPRARRPRAGSTTGCPPRRARARAAGRRACPAATRAPCAQVSVQATRCAPFSSPVSSRSSFSSATVLAGSSGTARC